MVSERHAHRDVAQRRVDDLEQRAGLAVLDHLGHRVGLGDGDLVDAVGEDDDAGLAVGIDDRIGGRGLRDVQRVGGDVGEDRHVRVRPGLRGRVPADDLDPGLGGLLDHRRLLVGVDAAEDDDVRLQRDRLVERAGAAGDGGLAVERAGLPADGLGGLLDAFAGTAGAAVALIGRDVDDQLAGLGLRAVRRARPWRVGLRELLHDRLRVGHAVIGLGRGRSSRQGHRAGQQQHSQHASSSHCRTCSQTADCDGSASCMGAAIDALRCFTTPRRCCA